MLISRLIIIILVDNARDVDGEGSHCISGQLGLDCRIASCLGGGSKNGGWRARILLVGFLSPAHTHADIDEHESNPRHEGPYVNGSELEVGVGLVGDEEENSPRSEGNIVNNEDTHLWS